MESEWYIHDIMRAASTLMRARDLVDEVKEHQQQSLKEFREFKKAIGDLAEHCGLELSPLLNEGEQDWMAAVEKDTSVLYGEIETGGIIITKLARACGCPTRPTQTT